MILQTRTMLVHGGRSTVMATSAASTRATARTALRALVSSTSSSSRPWTVLNQRSASSSLHLSAFALSSSASSSASSPYSSMHRRFAFSSSSASQSPSYHIEASNAARADCTTLTVTGPDVDGVLASMTVALALEGCSVVGLHAAKSASPSERTTIAKSEEEGAIQDVFSVVNRTTGEAFPNEDLPRLAQALVKAVQSPMKALGSTTTTSTTSSVADRNGGDGEEEADGQAMKEPVISIVPSSAS